MREYNAFGSYPPPASPRLVGSHIRTIRSRIIASQRDREYYDGDRNNGYGGFKYDGRWKPIAASMALEYQLGPRAAILQVGCEKGFLLHDFRELLPEAKLCGLEISPYAVANAMPSVQADIRLQDSFAKLPYADGEFDFVIAAGVVYTLNLRDAISCLKDIQRVGKGKSFITLGAYRNETERRLFLWWTVLGTTILHVDEWREVLREAGYMGDYTFTTAESLNLSEAAAVPGR